ncbi:universal stress protein [Nitrosovibrio sp. Nv6]|uniref:universal stress protein n=1 Tax=Nitrosovibrio sp. Nv6 TaxID=1855340 RepID=UPI0008B993B3|nr:universal stress protein [Nitrosovibrio sp. Nv6]SEO44685.1 Nucleotide-binding universal stress protein, UspA family [Nitrosovibrio sp. Nv6]
MPAIKTILVATDLSEFSHRAGIRAAMICSDLKCGTVELLTVKEAGLPDALGLVLKSAPTVAETVLVDRAMRELRLISGQLHDNYGIHCTNNVKFGRPVEEIVARADELSAELTVIGAHGGNFFTDLFLGNTADKLARMSKTPMLLVKNQSMKAYRQVLVPVDFSENSRRAAHMALNIAPDAHITFLHVFDVVLEEQMQYVNVAHDIIHEHHVKAGEDARRELNQFIADLEAGSRSFFRVVKFGHPGHVICDHAKSMKPDLIVLGKHGKSRFEELLLGSASRHVMEQCFCDVLIVPAPVWMEPGEIGL